MKKKRARSDLIETYKTSPQSILRRARRKGRIGFHDIVRFKPNVLAEYSNSTALVSGRQTLSNSLFIDGALSRPIH